MKIRKGDRVVVASNHPWESALNRGELWDVIRVSGPTGLVRRGHDCWWIPHDTDLFDNHLYLVQRGS